MSIIVAVWLFEAELKPVDPFFDLCIAGGFVFSTEPF